MTCQRCSSERVASINGKTADLCHISLGTKNDSDYVPEDMNIGSGDYLKFQYCLDCGQIQGEWPLPQVKLEEDYLEDSDWWWQNAEEIPGELYP